MYRSTQRIYITPTLKIATLRWVSEKKIQKIYYLNKAVAISTQCLFHLGKQGDKTKANKKPKWKKPTFHLLPLAHSKLHKWPVSKPLRLHIFRSYLKILSKYLCTIVWHKYTIHRTLPGFCVIKTPPLSESRKKCNTMFQ